MACPGTYPTVLNGQISYNDSSTAEYACLSGFYMTGTKRITCSSGVWQTAPTCNVIEQADDVFPDWWLIVAAVVLLLLVLACILCIACYFCCGRGHATFVTPYGPDHNITDGGNTGGRCCGDNGFCRSGCCGRQGNCCSCSNGCSCTQGCCRAGAGCCATTSGCCLLGGSAGGCCCCCRGNGTKGKKGVGKQGKVGWDTSVTQEKGGVNDVITTPPKSQVTVISQTNKKGKKEKKEKKQMFDVETQPNAHYVYIPADGDRHGTHRHSSPNIVYQRNNSPPINHAHVIHGHTNANSNHAHVPQNHTHNQTTQNHAHANQSHVHVVHGHAHDTHNYAHDTHSYAHDTHSHNPHSPSVLVSSTGQAPPCSCCSPNEVQSPRGGWILVRDTVAHKNLKDSEMVKLDVLETRSDGDVGTDRPAKPKKQAKEIKAWIPHSNPVRSINTSTK